MNMFRSSVGTIKSSAEARLHTAANSARARLIGYLISQQEFDELPPVSEDDALLAEHQADRRSTFATILGGSLIDRLRGESVGNDARHELITNMAGMLPRPSISIATGFYSGMVAQSEYIVTNDVGVANIQGTMVSVAEDESFGSTKLPFVEIGRSNRTSDKGHPITDLLLAGYEFKAAKGLCYEDKPRQLPIKIFKSAIWTSELEILDDVLDGATHMGDEQRLIDMYDSDKKTYVVRPETHLFQLPKNYPGPTRSDRPYKLPRRMRSADSKAKWDSIRRNSSIDWLAEISPEECTPELLEAYNVLERFRHLSHQFGFFNSYRRAVQTAQKAGVALEPGIK